MKKRIIPFVLFCLLSVLPAVGQDPPPPPSGGHGQGGNAAPGGSSPIGGGAVILLALGAGYGFYKKTMHTKSDENTTPV